MILFIWGRFRFDLVALTALLAAVLLNLVPAVDAFVGFGHPAVITVAAVLVLSQSLSNSGALDALADKVLGAGNSTIVHLAVLCSMGAVFSA
ncbi:MAG: SLC13 family permease, partial [Pseudomonadota bacterium]